MLNNIKKLFAVLLVLTLFAASAAPAYASGTDTELDFSASDDINAYDSYAKESWRMDGSLFLQTQAIGMTTIDLMPIKITVLGLICGIRMRSSFFRSSM